MRGEAIVPDGWPRSDEMVMQIPIGGTGCRFAVACATMAPVDRIPCGGIYRGEIVSDTTYNVTGMTCDHCVRSVKEEVGTVPGVTDVRVDLASGRLTVRGTEPIDETLVKAAVEEAGYEVTG
jgi:copper chaperone